MKLNLGCGGRKLDGFVNVDANPRVKPGHHSDIRKLGRNFKAGSADEIRAYHVLEHLSEADGLSVLRQCFAVLKCGGRLYLELPALNGVIRDYLYAGSNCPKLLKQRIFGMQRNQFDFHLWGYTFNELAQVLQEIGFTDVRRKEPDNNWHGGPILAVEAFKP